MDLRRRKLPFASASPRPRTHSQAMGDACRLTEPHGRVIDGGLHAIIGRRCREGLADARQSGTPHVLPRFSGRVRRAIVVLLGANALLAAMGHWLRQRITAVAGGPTATQRVQLLGPRQRRFPRNAQQPQQLHQSRRRRQRIRGGAGGGGGRSVRRCHLSEAGAKRGQQAGAGFGGKCVAMLTHEQAQHGTTAPWVRWKSWRGSDEHTGGRQVQGGGQGGKIGFNHKP